MPFATATASRPKILHHSKNSNSENFYEISIDMLNQSVKLFASPETTTAAPKGAAADAKFPEGGFDLPCVTTEC